MKKQSFPLMMVITVIFCAFTLGFFLGRNQNHETIYLSSLETVPSHNALPKSVEYSDSSAAQVSFPVDINAAGLDELSALPGIGKTLAQRILDFRAVNGSFAVPEDLMNVSGIGPGKLEAILDYITTGG